MTTSAYTHSMSGKYRTRTWLRGHLPWLLAQHIPKGVDCGAHEFYRQDADIDACYHCRVTRPHNVTPATVAELEMLEREIRHGSTAAGDVLAARIREGAAQVVPHQPAHL